MNSIDIITLLLHLFNSILQCWVKIICIRFRAQPNLDLDSEPTMNPTLPTFQNWNKSKTNFKVFIHRINDYVELCDNNLEFSALIMVGCWSDLIFMCHAGAGSCWVRGGQCRVRMLAGGVGPPPHSQSMPQPAPCSRPPSPPPWPLSPAPPHPARPLLPANIAGKKRER